MFISCSASSAESDEDNKIADRPITPKEMQNIRDIINLGVEWQERTGIPTWVGAWMPGNYN